MDRTAGAEGVCRTGSSASVSHGLLHFGEEPAVSGKSGSGTIFFTGCNIKCLFCQNYQLSWDLEGEPVSDGELGAMMLGLQAQGMRLVSLAPTSTGKTDYLMVVLRDVSQQLDVVGPGTANSGTVTVLLFGDPIPGAADLVTPGAPELVVYNAGNAFVRPLLDTTDESFEAVWRLGCFGGFLAGREAARLLLAWGRGTILFTGATASGLHFADNSTGFGFRYGLATWIDASGVDRAHPAPSFAGGRITMEVPEEIVRASRFPATLDPLISAEFGIDTIQSGKSRS